MGSVRLIVSSFVLSCIWSRSTDWVKRAMAQCAMSGGTFVPCGSSISDNNLSRMSLNGIGSGALIIIAPWLTRTSLRVVSNGEKLAIISRARALYFAYHSLKCCARERFLYSVSQITSISVMCRHFAGVSHIMSPISRLSSSCRALTFCTAFCESRAAMLYSSSEYVSGLMIVFGITHYYRKPTKRSKTLIGIRDSNPILTEVEFVQYKKDAQVSASLPLLSKLAGGTSSAGNPLFTDFISVGRQLEKLGFTFQRGKILLLEPLEKQ